MTRRIALLVAWTATHLLAGLPHPASAADLPGVVVVGIGEGSALKKTDLQPGDEIVAWSRLPSTPKGAGAQGDVRSPFDLVLLEREETTRGPVNLIGFRAGKSFFVHVPPGKWRLTARPSLPERLETERLRGEGLLAEGKVGEAAAVLKKTATTVLASGRPLAAAWIHLRSGKLLQAANDAESARAAFDLARDAAKKARRPALEALVASDIDEALAAPPAPSPEP